MPRQNGFVFIPVMVVIVIILSLGVSYFVFSQKSDTKQNSSKYNDSGVLFNSAQGPQNDKNSDQKEPPLKIKSIGVNLDYFDPKTGSAGDFVFTKQKLQFNRLFMGFGFVIPGNETSSGQDKSNPQPTFILPLGTPVRSLVDGVVANIPTVWSGDYSIQITESGQLERWVYEVEHVLNPKVKVGDKVVAGQIIAEVSDFDKGAPEGYGAVEIGILHGGGEGPPEHVCPFAYLDPSVKEDIEKKIVAFYKSWDDYRGDSTLYDESIKVPGCLTLDPIEG